MMPVSVSVVLRDRTLRLLTIGRALRSFSQGYLGIIVPLYMTMLGYSVAQVGLFVTVWAGAGALLTVASGFLGDRYGRKPLLVTFSLFAALAGLAFAFDAPLWVLLLAGALGTIGRGGGPASGGAFGPYYPVEQALIAERARDADRNRIFGAFSFFGAIAGAAGTLVTHLPAAAARWQAAPLPAGYRDVFLLTTALGIAMTAVALALEESRVSPRAGAVERRSLGRPTLRLLGQFAITNATNGLAVGFLGPMLVLWFHLRYGATESQIGTIYFVVALVAAIPYLNVGRIVSLIGGAVRMVVALRVLSCFLLAAVPFMPALWLAGLVYAVRMLFNVATLPVRQSYLMGVLPAEERSRGASVANLPSQVFSTVGPAIAGVILHEWWIGAMLEIASVLQLLNAALYWSFFHAAAPPEERVAEVVAESPK